MRPLVVVNATVLSGPCSTGMDWRVDILKRFLSCRDLRGYVEGLSSGETFARNDVCKGDLVMGNVATVTSVGLLPPLVNVPRYSFESNLARRK